MARIYPTGGLIEELGGTIRGGVSVVMNHPGELRIVANICAAARNSNAPMYALYGLLNSSQLFETSPALQNGKFSWEGIEPREVEHPGRALMAAVSYVETLWGSASDDQQFTCVLSVARPEGDVRLDLDIDRPGLVFHFGSILATLAKGSLRVAGWSLALFSGRGVGGSKRADRIMEDLRAQALKKPGVEPLARLDELSSRNLEGKSAVIVLMHGLFSTDVGLFDPLLRFLRADSGFENCTILGWPHNTLMSIDGNAVELLELFSTVVGLRGPQVAFICHSRGGLVARAAAVELCEANRKWRDKLKACVTFGTPHRGSQLAETPDQLIGSLLALQAYHGGEGFFSLADALHFAHQQPIAGVRDMRPLGGDGAFLRDLVRREVKIAATSARSMPILAIGGEAKEKTFFATLARRALGGTANDLVVETTSSANRTATETLVTECNHFEYFRVANSPRNGFEETASFLRARLGLPEHKIGIYKQLQIKTAESPVSVPVPPPKKDDQ